MSIDSTDYVDNNANIEVATPLSDQVTDVPHGDSFSFTEFLTLEDHIQLLKQRGLVFKNSYEEVRFLTLLNTVGYYRLSQYFKHFYTPNNSKIFIGGTSSKSIVSAYRQNERLRSLLIDALLKLESKLRTYLTEQLIVEKQDVYWCEDPGFQDLNLLSKATQKKFDKKARQYIYSEQSTKLFFEQYPRHQRIPAWVVMQCQEFGCLCLLVKHPKVPKKISKSMVGLFKLSREYNYDSIYSVFDALRHLRNLCVHHEKLLGENIRIAPPLWTGLDPAYAHRLPNFLYWIEHLLQVITTRDSFSNELREIINIVNRDCPESMHIALKPLADVLDPSAKPSLN